MPEYLAPGVYVEEVDTGAKPIEGVSTSTCGVVGVCERGPVDVPVLITSVGEFARTFGGRLPADYFGGHCYLPHAIEGFFSNGGKRVYVVRTIDPSASRSQGALYDRGGATPAGTTLLVGAGEGTGTAALPPPLFVLSGSGLGVGDTVRIGDGSSAEYRKTTTVPASASTKGLVTLDFPLSRSHATPGTTGKVTPGPVLAGLTVVDAVDAGAVKVVVEGTTAEVGNLASTWADAGTDFFLEFAVGSASEYRAAVRAAGVVVSGANARVEVELDAPLLRPYASGQTIAVQKVPAPTAPSAIIMAAVGSEFILKSGAAPAVPAVLVIGQGEAGREVRQVGTLSTVTVTPSTAHHEPGELIESVELAESELAVATGIGAVQVTLNPGQMSRFVVGQQICIEPGASQEIVTVTAVGPGDVLAVNPKLAKGHGIAAPVRAAPVALKSKAPAGATVLALDNRLGLVIGSLIEVGVGTPSSQWVTVTAVPGATKTAPDSGIVAIYPALSAEQPLGTPIQAHGGVTGKLACTLALAPAAGQTTLTITDGSAWTAPGWVRVTSAAGRAVYYQHSVKPTAAAPKSFEVDAPLDRSHAAGSAVERRTKLVDVEALDQGTWGDRLRISVADDEAGLVGRTTLATFVNATTIRLASRAGVQPGTVLEFRGPTTNAVLGDLVKVVGVDRLTSNILLAAPGLAPSQQAVGTVVRSREFTLTVSLLRQPDPAAPSRNGQVMDRETFRSLSLDPRHSNYLVKVIGQINDGSQPLRRWDHRTDGASLYIRVADVALPAAREATREGPEVLQDVLPDGRIKTAQRKLDAVRGDDAIGLLNDGNYVGADNVDPERRTGLESLRNIEEVSLVAIPGQVSAAVQQAIIDHCELMRYRFAVLDSASEPHDTLADAQAQRQQFDTKYAAMYYPWLSIPDPFPASLADVHDYALPPAGHMLGVYARTDIERGVHKAPANEVVRGITGLRRKLTKEQQDILNPYPVNINVIRDFRDHNRGIRVYGGRVIASDPDWKYVNVRRLLIFIEASIDRGLQWVVFEPNSEPLWARVRRVISNFLEVAWRNGALEGTSPEEAFFVRCDRTTMTQTDIDNGRLIVQVGVAPVKPAEFVIVRIGLWTARSES